MKCPNCNTEIIASAKFCQKCGSPVPETETAAPAANYDMDDLYFAAQSRDTGKMRTVLNAQPDLVNAFYDTEDDSGAKIHAGVIFSILADMNSSGVSREVLNVLKEYNADFNQLVDVVYSTGESSRPLLYYPVAIWGNLELTRCLLELGANPDGEVCENVNGGVQYSYLTMLYYALVENEGAEIANALLAFGADPNKHCRPFLAGEGVTQLIPPLVYSIVDCNSMEKTLLLMVYGAKTSVPVDLGKGFKRRNSLAGYINYGFSDRVPMMNACANKVARMKKPQVTKVYQPPAAVKQSDMPTAAVERAVSPRKSTPSDRQAELIAKKCYNKFTAYLFMNFAILGLGFGIIGPVIMAQKEPEAALGLLCFGIPCIALAVLIGVLVYMKGKKRGQISFFGEFIMDSFMIWIKVFMIMTLILIPFALMIGKGAGDWQYRKTTDGREVYVKTTGDGTYEDAYGTTYVKQDDN